MYAICLFQVAIFTRYVTSNKNTHKMNQLYGCKKNSCTEYFDKFYFRSISQFYLFSLSFSFYHIQFNQVWKLFSRFHSVANVYICAARFAKPISFLINKIVYIAMEHRRSISKQKIDMKKHLFAYTNTALSHLSDSNTQNCPATKHTYAI